MGDIPKILIVEDEENFSQILEFCLNDVGYQVVLAKNGVEGLTLFNSENPDIILTDITMPKMDGQEFIKRIRKISKTVPIVVMTGMFSKLDDIFEPEENIELIRKPFTDEDILPILERLTQSPSQS